MPPRRQRRSAPPGSGQLRRNEEHRLFNAVSSRPQRLLRSVRDTIDVQMQGDVSAFLTTSNAIPTYAVHAFLLSDFYQSAEYTALFDQYKIVEIECWITGSSVELNSGSVYSAVDLDDATVPTAVGSVAAKQGALAANSTVSHYHRWKPCVAVAAYNGAFAGYAAQPDQWLNCSYPSIQHYGLKMASEAMTSAELYNLSFRAHVQFRAPGV
jgi:hypothetical protein